MIRIRKTKIKSRLMVYPLLIISLLIGIISQISALMRSGSLLFILRRRWISATTSAITTQSEE